MDKGEIILYQPNNTVSVEVRLVNDDVWLNRQQIATLFDRDIKTIGKHINNALKEELADFSLVANFATSESNNGLPFKRWTKIQYQTLYQRFRV